MLYEVLTSERYEMPPLILPTWSLEVYQRTIEEGKQRQCCKSWNELWGKGYQHNLQFSRRVVVS